MMLIVVLVLELVVVSYDVGLHMMKFRVSKDENNVAVAKCMVVFQCQWRCCDIKSYKVALVY